jgi:hypothetical protein
MIARLVRAQRTVQQEQADAEWREIVAAIAADRAQRGRWHAVGTALLAGALAGAAIVAVAVVTHAGTLLR